MSVKLTQVILPDNKIELQVEGFPVYTAATQPEAVAVTDAIIIALEVLKIKANFHVKLDIPAISSGINQVGESGD